MLENTEGAIKNGQSRETGNIGYTRRRKTKQKHNTICVRHHSWFTAQANTNNVKQIIRHEPSYKQLEVKTNRTSSSCENRNGHHNMELRTLRHILGKHTVNYSKIFT